MPAAISRQHSVALVAIVLASLLSAASNGGRATAAQSVAPWVIFSPAESSLAVPPNHLTNPGFEMGDSGEADDWRGYGEGYEIDESGGRGGGRALKLVASVNDEVHGASQTITLSQPAVRPLYFSGWSRASGVTGETDSSYSVYMDIRYTDGTPLYGRTLRFATGSHGWQFVDAFVMPAKPIESIAFYCLLRNTHTGTVWFDDLTLQEVALGAEVYEFDGVQVATTRPEPPPYGGPNLAIGTADGLGLALSSDGGAITQVRLGAAEVQDATRAYAGGFFLRDVAAQTDFVHVAGQVSETPRGLTHNAQLSDQGLSFSADYEALADRISIHAEFAATDPVTRALTVYFALPVDAGGWQWGDDIRRSRPVEGVTELANYRYRSSIGANGKWSKYPWAALAGPDHGIALAIPIDSPRVMRFVCNPATNQLYVAFDLGLSPLTAKFPNSAWVDIIIYRFDAEQGFRAATQGYYDRFPHFFQRRLPPEEEGLWVAFSDLSGIPDIQDFGIRIHELGRMSQTEFDDTVGIRSFRYIAEPWSHWLPINDEAVDPEQYDQVVDYLHRRQAEGETRAEATLSSGFFDTEGRYVYQSTVRPWCEGVAGCAVFTVNPDPDIESPTWPLNKGRFEWSDKDREAYEKYPGLDGEYIDSYSGQATTLDYRMAHFSAIDTPLTYRNAQDRRLGFPQIFATTEFARWVTNDVHDRLGKLTMANGMLSDMPWGADLFEFMGRETNWLRTGEFRADTDERLSYQRTLSYQRPYGLLMNTWFESFTYELVERYFQVALFYGIYPSMFSHNAASDRYWDDSSLYERDRPLFKRYIPLIRSLNVAGWRPVTYARVAEPDVYIERFGSWPLVYFTVRNMSDEETVTAHVTLDGASLGLPPMHLEAKALVGGTRHGLGGAGRQRTIELDLPPAATEVLRLGGEAVYVPLVTQGASGPNLAEVAPGAERAPRPELFLPLLSNSATALGAAPIEVPDPLEGFFSLQRIHQIEIEVGDDGVDELRERPREYVPARVTIDDHEYPEVGVRLKGAAGSFIPIGGDRPPVSGDGNGRPGKYAFIIDFNRYVSGVTHHGLKKLTVNNMVQDPSCMHEFLGYELFRAGGVPASRMGYGMIAFNGEDKGLYALIESPDNDEFLERWYSTSAGNLYEGQYGVDLRAEAIEEYDQDNGADTSRQDLYELVEALDALSPGDDPLETLERHFDLELYLAFATTELYLGHWDGYAWSTNNYVLHHSPIDDKWTFLPWGIDQLFGDGLGQYGGVMREPGPSWGEGGGRIHELCFRSTECRDRLAAAFDDLLDRVEASDLLLRAEKVRQLVAPIALEEAREFGDPNVTIEALNQVSRFISHRREHIEAWLPCLAGETVDHDRDGYNGCTVDCDDFSPSVHPGATERCNIRDDDCNGIIDDPPECPKCVTEAMPDGREYSLCFNALSWEDAHRYCVERGQNLASIHDEETAERLTWSAIERLGMHEAWIGLNDLVEEGQFEWTDGSALDFERWEPYSPKRHGEGTDCVINLPPGWADIPCDDAHAFMCGPTEDQVP